MALVRVQRSPGAVGAPQESGSTTSIDDDDEFSRSGKSLSECYFASKGAAVVLPGGGGGGVAGNGKTKRSGSGSSDIQLHLQSMFYLLRSEETLKMAVKLESVHPQRTRYLVVVSRSGAGGAEEACLLGIDCNETTTVGLVLRVFADTAITLDGDGGFSVSVCSSQHIFKPVSVQAMWSALQTLHRASGTARDQNYFQGGTSHDWVSYYEKCIESDRSCLNEWHAMDSIESRRPPSPDSVRTKPRERDETERVIKNTLKEIMMSVDLDEVTSKVIRGRLEEDLDMDLGEFKSFIDEEMITILGQMDAPTEIFEHVYLGSEWNASNLEELQKNGVRHILNVTREIDNFFPGMFDYHNVRVYDDEKTDLLKHWDKTFKYISKAKDEGSKVLVHCKMGVSRSASVVIAYAMKAYDWKLDKAISHVKTKRTCIKPNTSFITQLETYQGILDAMKNKDKLQRSKSETNLKSPGMVSKTDSSVTEPTPFIQASSGRCRGRPRSWSPDTRLASQILPPTSVSLENLAPESGNVIMKDGPNGSYSVSQNQIMHLKKDCNVKKIVYGIESHATNERKNLKERSILKLNLGMEFDRCSVGNCNDYEDIDDKSSDVCDIRFEPVQSGDAITNNIQSRQFMDKKDTWDPGERTIESKKKYFDSCNDIKDLNEIVKCDSGVLELRGKSRQGGDTFSKHVDHVFDKEERQHGGDCEGMGAPPSRQSSWSSCDSAVVLEKLSRNSSCGSYDNKPSRNSSMGSYDEQCHTGTVKRTKQKLEESCNNKLSCSDLDTLVYNGAQETVSTHKLLAPTCDLDIIKESFEQKCKKAIKNNSNANGISDSVINNIRPNNRLGAILREPDFNRADDFCNSRKEGSCYTQLSASAPTGSCINNIDSHSFRPSSSHGNLSTIKQIDPIHFQTFKSNGSKIENNNHGSRNAFGKVMNLKIKFESNIHGKDDSKNVNSDVDPHGNPANNSKGKSLPSSPVSVHNDKKAQLEPEKNNIGHTTSLEDLSVKGLVGKYDRPKSQQFAAKLSSEPPVPMRKSSLNRDIDSKAQKKSIHSPRNSLSGIFKNPSTLFRPPIPTVVSIPTFSNSASHPNRTQRKQMQHGKTHPLTRLNFNKNHTTNRCVNPAYNTM